MAHITTKQTDRQENRLLLHPTLKKLLEMKGDSIYGLAYALKHNVKVDSDNDYGQLTLELVLMLPELISENMKSEQTLKDFLASRITKG